jgi:hypothetical protein
MSFGKTAEVAYGQFNHRDEKGYFTVDIVECPF